MEMKEKPGSRKEICVICSTAPPEQSSMLAKSLLDQNLAACVNIAPVRSLYRWKGEFCDEEEHLLIIKTQRELEEAVIHAIKAVHPSEVPEIIVLPVTAGYGPYLAWVHEQTRGP
jgi:periplasmic divalent cation tolerance protein